MGFRGHSSATSSGTTLNLMEHNKIWERTLKTQRRRNIRGSIRKLGKLSTHQVLGIQREQTRGRNRPKIRTKRILRVPGQVLDRLLSIVKFDNWVRFVFWIHCGY